jgi:hypothetical protein
MRSQLNHLEPVFPDIRKALPPGPINEDDNQYIIERILQHRSYKGRRQYLIRWLGYTMEDDTWEPASSIRAQALALVRQYEALQDL